MQFEQVFPGSIVNTSFYDVYEVDTFLDPKVMYAKDPSSY